MATRENVRSWFFCCFYQLFCMRSGVRSFKRHVLFSDSQQGITALCRPFIVIEQGPLLKPYLILESSRCHQRSNQIHISTSFELKSQGPWDRHQNNCGCTGHRKSSQVSLAQATFSILQVLRPRVGRHLTALAKPATLQRSV